MSVPVTILCIAAAVFLLGQIRLGCSVEYSNEGPKVWICVGVVRIQVFPVSKKTGKQKKAKPSKKEKKKATVENKKPSLTEKVGGALDYFERLFPIVVEALEHFRRKLQVDVLRIEMTFGAGDPADAALRYGQASAALGAWWYPLVEMLNVKDGYAETKPDFEADAMTVYLYGKLSLKAGQILWFVVYFGLRSLKAFLAVRKQHKRKKI